MEKMERRGNIGNTPSDPEPPKCDPVEYTVPSLAYVRVRWQSLKKQLASCDKTRDELFSLINFSQDEVHS